MKGSSTPFSAFAPFSRGSSRGSDALEKLEEGQSLRSILVTRELQRSSVRLARPEMARVEGRGWSEAQIRGGVGVGRG